MSDETREPEVTDTDAEREQFLSALVTEHFVLQSMRWTVTGEGASRASIYLASLSSGLVAIGFAISGGAPIGWFAAPVLITLFALGEITFVRLVEIALEDIDHLRDLLRVRSVYGTLGPSAERFFGGSAGPDDWSAVERSMVSRRRGQVWFTMASLVAVVNSSSPARASAPPCCGRATRTVSDGLDRSEDSAPRPWSDEADLESGAHCGANTREPAV